MTLLRESEHAPHAHRWVREPTSLLTGKDYINCLRLRINALPTRSRTTRGRANIDRQCRAGCGVPETVNHVVQTCYRTHARRVNRHDAIVKYVQRSLTNRGYTTELEPIVRTSEGTLKPDLIATKGTDELLVLDAQVRTDGNLDLSNRQKVEKYSKDVFLNHVEEKWSIERSRTKVLGVTLNWRGIWSKESVKSLLDANVISKRDTAVLSTRVAIGSVSCFNIFNRTTIVRAGIG